jgi:hypothetical protein
MTDPMKKWAQGDEWEPSASWINMVTEAALQVQQALGRPTLGDSQLWQPFTPIRMYNDTGAAIPRLGVVSYSEGPLVLPSSNEHLFTHQLTLKAKAPQADGNSRFAIALNRVEIDGVFWGAIGGVVPCRVTGTGSSVVSIEDDVEKLQAGDEGVPLIWSESGETERYGICRIDESGAAGCRISYDLRLLYRPATAVLTITVLYDGVSEVIDIEKDDVAADIKAAIDAHSKFVEHEVECTVEMAGPLYSSNAFVVLPAGASITDHTASMTRGDLRPPPEFRVDICGCGSP